MRLRLSPYPADTWTDGGTGVAGGLVGPQEQLHLGRLADGVGRDRHVADPVGRLPGERHDPRSSPALAGRRRGRFRRRQQAGLAEVGRVRVAGRLALDDPDACARGRARRSPARPCRRPGWPTTSACPPRTPRRTRLRCAGPRRAPAGTTSWSIISSAMQPSLPTSRRLPTVPDGARSQIRPDPRPERLGEPQRADATAGGRTRGASRGRPGPGGPWRRRRTSR